MTDGRHNRQNSSTQQTVGVLLTNLGTPDAPTAAALRRYLQEFLSDPRIVEMPRWLWWPILHGVILPLRPRRSAHAYQSIWTAQGSPLLSISRQQTQALQLRLQQQFPEGLIVELAMRYGHPSLVEGMEKLRRAGAGKVLVLPLYPQYSATTTASTLDALGDLLKSWRQIPALRFISSYHDHDGYIGALADSIQEHWCSHGQADILLFSFHGTPQSMRDAGDPYFDQCHATVQAVVDRLQLPEQRWRMAFQSRFGRQQWLQPYTDKTLRGLAQDGCRSVDVICPGFSADCLETLEEIAILNRNNFLDAGGEEYRYIAALNDREDHIAALQQIVTENLCGWLNLDSEVGSA